jgi:hypothetical protein
MYWVQITNKMVFKKIFYKNIRRPSSRQCGILNMQQPCTPPRLYKGIALIFKFKFYLNNTFYTVSGKTTRYTDVHIVSLVLP